MIDVAVSHVELTHSLSLEMTALIEDYYENTPAHTDIPPYDFNWSLYQSLSDAGQLVVVTARVGELLVGYAMYIVTHAAHHQTLLVAECDTLSVDIDFRGMGIAEKVYAYAETLLRQRGVKQVFNRYRVCYGTKPLFEKLGFHVTEHVYMKEL